MIPSQRRQLEVAASQWSGGAIQGEKRQGAAAVMKAATETAETAADLKEAAETARWPQCCRTRYPLPPT